MTPILVTIILLSLAGYVWAEPEVLEEDIEQVTLDLMVPPTCPAAIMLGISPSQIVRPSNIADFGVYISDVSEGFTTVPSDFAVQVAPFWVGGFGRNMTLAEFASGSDVIQNSLQSLSISIASRGTEVDTIAVRRLAVSLGFTPARGAFGERGYTLEEALAEVNSIMDRVNGEWAELSEQTIASDSILLSWEAQRDAAEGDTLGLLAKIAEREEMLSQVALQQVESRYAADLERLESIIESVANNRTGFKLDLAAGCIFEIPELSFDDGQLTQLSAWGTFGYEWSQSFLLAGAWYRHDAGETDLSSIDVGASVGLTGLGPLEVSGEFLGRFFTESDDLEDQWRTVVGVSYRVWKGTSVAASFGRGFGDEGSLISALSIGLALGSDRPGGI